MWAGLTPDSKADPTKGLIAANGGGERGRTGAGAVKREDGNGREKKEHSAATTTAFVHCNDNRQNC